MKNHTIKLNRCSLNYLTLIVLIYIFVFRDLLEQKISLFGYFDECFAALTIPIFFINLYKHGMKVKLYKKNNNLVYIGFLIAGLLGNLVYQYQPFWKAVISSAFLNLKFWLALYVAYYMFKNFDIELYAKRVSRQITLITTIFVLLVVIDNVFHIFQSDTRYGMRSTQLFYNHASFFAAVCAFLIVISTALYRYVVNNKVIITLLLLMASTLRSKAIAGVLCFILLFYYILLRKRKFNIRTLFFLIFTSIIISWNQIKYYFFIMSNDSARYQLLIKSFEIVWDHFPLGSGFATFASHFSGLYYSPLYYTYKLNNINGLRIGSAIFVSDTFWPMIIGETGVFGLTFFILILWRLFCKIQNLKKICLEYYLSALFAFVYLLIVSLAESAFVHPASISLALWIGVMFAQRKGDYNENFNDK